MSVVRARKVRVLIVDDSASVRQALKDVLSADPEIEVIGSASDPFAAAQIMQRETPDVITLDVEMPRMDGLTFLRKLMAQHPIPVVMCSSLVTDTSDTIMEALSHEKHTTVLFVEHDMDIVERHASRVIAFYAGRVIADDSPAVALATDDVRRYVTGELLAE